MDPYKLSMTASSGLWDAPKLNDDCSCLNTLLAPRPPPHYLTLNMRFRCAFLSHIFHHASTYSSKNGFLDPNFIKLEKTRIATFICCQLKC